MPEDLDNVAPIFRKGHRKFQVVQFTVSSKLDEILIKDLWAAQL